MHIGIKACTTKGYTMAKKKQDYIEEAKQLGLKVSDKLTIEELKLAIKGAQSNQAKSETNDYAKAGKRSKKAETEKLEAAKKLDPAANTEEKSTKKPQPKPRPMIDRRGKKYQEAAKKIDRSNDYSLEDAINLTKETSTVKFDASVELHFNLNVDPKQADQNVRGTVSLPHGSGKESRVAVFGNEEDVKKAKAAGADIAKSDDLLEDIKKEVIDFDVLISTPQQMAKLGQYAKILGPKGLMPNPKSGTVTNDVAKAVKEAKGGRLEFRVDKQSIVHCSVGKVSFSDKALIENIQAVYNAIHSARPASLKTTYITSVWITSSMGPSVKLDTKSIAK